MSESLIGKLVPLNKVSAFTNEVFAGSKKNSLLFFIVFEYLVSDHCAQVQEIAPNKTSKVNIFLESFPLSILKLAVSSRFSNLSGTNVVSGACVFTTIAFVFVELRHELRLNIKSIVSKYCLIRMAYNVPGLSEVGDFLIVRPELKLNL